MTEKEVFETQEQNGNTQFYLIRNGIFFHANGHGAYALSRVTGYKAMSKHRKEGDIVQTGFGVKQIAKVIKKIEAARGTVQKIDEDTYLFNGIDGTPDESIIATTHRTPSPCKGELPKFYRYNVGTRLVDLCLDMLALIYQANMDRDARQQYLTQLLICNHKIEMLLRVCFRKKIFTAGRYAVYMQLQVSIGKQATAWKKNVEH